MVPPTNHNVHGPQKFKSIINLLRSRELGGIKCIDISQIPESSSRLPFVWQRRTLNPGDRNKIFACQWITNNHVVYGTKCNNLVLYDCNSSESFDIPLIKSKNQDVTCPCSCGIHSIQLNTSKTFLATGGDNVNHIGVYRLTEFSPHCLLSDCHKDWVFDLRWLDDTCLASCSRDSSLALWRIPSPSENTLGSVTTSIHKDAGVKSGTSVLHIKSPVAYAKSSVPYDRFRALEYLPTQTNLAVVSMSRRLYLYDAVRMGLDKHTRPVYTLLLRNAYQEAVALRRWPSEPNCIALATHHCVLLFDIRCSTNKIGAEVRCILPPLHVSGVRSLNFSKSILSYGTSSGQVHFYDLRSEHHLPIQLDIGPGWVKPQNCDDYELPTMASMLGSLSSRFNTQPLVTTTSTTTTSWNVPSPPPSPAHHSALMTNSSSSNIVRPLRWLQPQNDDNFNAQVNNLRLRINRIHNHLEYLRNRHRVLSIMHPIINQSTSSSSSRRRSRSSRSNNSMEQNVNIATTSSLSESNFPDDNDDDDNDGDNNDDGDGDNDNNNNDETHPTINNNDTANVVNRVDIVDNVDPTNVLTNLLPSLSEQSRRISLAINNFTNVTSDIFSYPTIYNQRRMLAVYTHEYDPSGTRLFTAGGPIASTFHGNVASIWE